MLKGYEIGNDLAERRLAVYEFFYKLRDINTMILMASINLF